MSLLGCGGNFDLFADDILVVGGACTMLLPPAGQTCDVGPSAYIHTHLGPGGDNVGFFKLGIEIN